MKAIVLRPGEPGRDFQAMAALFATEGDELTTELEIVKELETDGDRIIQKAALDEAGELLGFYWLYASKLVEGRGYATLIVKPEQRRQGVGGRLFADLEQAAAGAHMIALRVDVKDTCPECRMFAMKRGFQELSHQVEFCLDLDSFDDRPYEKLIEQLKGEGFEFTSMAALGNTEEMQRKLYELNNAAVIDTQGAQGEPAWKDFEDFQRSVCQAEWYRPEGQLVVIDSATGIWAAMSAITRFEGQDFAYNLFTGVERAYRGRKLGQAVKVTALRYAREALGVHSVHTHHNTKNPPMLAIDRKLGYVELAGVYKMEKRLSTDNRKDHSLNG